MSARGTTWLSMFNREPWQAEGVCRQVDHGDTWFPEKGGSTRAAKVVCFNCPVIEECAEYAIRTEEPHGIWGGYSERERWRIRRGEEVVRRIPGERERSINECQVCGGPFTGRGKYCGEDCRFESVTASRRKRYQDAVDAHAKKSA